VNPDATRSEPSQRYSPECVEGEFSEVHIHYPEEDPSLPMLVFLVSTTSHGKGGTASSASPVGPSIR
jgi:hypothetical protein